jgi:mannose/cellobiose epimerase-like protein (N-acyl-D-glucosamine 2-epimerase family)
LFLFTFIFLKGALSAPRQHRRAAYILPLFFANKATESENNLKNQENMRLFSAFLFYPAISSEKFMRRHLHLIIILVMRKRIITKVN